MLRGQVSYQLTFGSFTDGKFTPGIPAVTYNRLYSGSMLLDSVPVLTQEHYVGGSTVYTSEIQEPVLDTSGTVGTWTVTTKAEKNVISNKNYDYKIFEYNISRNTAKTELPVVYRSEVVKTNTATKDGFTFLLTEKTRRNRKTFGLSITSDTPFTQEQIDALFKYVHNSPLVFSTVEKQRAIRQVNQLFDIHDTKSIQVTTPTLHQLVLTDELFRYYSMPIMGENALLVYTEDGVFLYIKELVKVAELEDERQKGNVYRGFYSDKFYAYDILNKKELTYEYRLRALSDLQMNIWLNPDPETFYLNNKTFLQASNRGILYIPNTSYNDTEMPWYTYTPKRIMRLKLHTYPDGTPELVIPGIEEDELFEGSPEYPLLDLDIEETKEGPGIYDFVVTYEDDKYTFAQLPGKKYKIEPKHSIINTWNELHKVPEIEEVFGNNMSDFYSRLTELKNAALEKVLPKKGSMLLIGSDVLDVKFNFELLSSFSEIFHVTTGEAVYPEMLHIKVPDYEVRTIFDAISKFRNVPFELIVCDTALAEVGPENMLEINRIFKVRNGICMILDMDKDELEALKFSEDNVLSRVREGKEIYITYKVVFDGNTDILIDKDEIKMAAEVRKEIIQEAKETAARAVRTRFGSAKEKNKYKQQVYQRVIANYDSMAKPEVEDYAIPALSMPTRDLPDFSKLFGGVLSKWNIPKLTTYDTNMYLKLFSIYHLRA